MVNTKKHLKSEPAILKKARGRSNVRASTTYPMVMTVFTCLRLENTAVYAVYSYRRRGTTAHRPN